MSDIFRLPQTAQISLHFEVQAAIQAILSVHQLPNLPTLEVRYTADGRFGGYTPASEERSRMLEVSAIGLTPRLTFVHEVGHFLDDAAGKFEVYSSQEPASPLSSVVAAAKHTQAIHDLRDYERVTRGTFLLERAQVMNRLDEVEVWARAYAQYIAIRSGDGQLLAEVQARRDIEVGILKNEQWEWKDFAPVALAIDDLMQHLGWRP